MEKDPITGAFGGFPWGTEGKRWPGEFEDPRFLKADDCRNVATEIERRPHIGPGYYKLPELPQQVANEFGPKSSSVGKQMDRFAAQCSHLQRTEAELNTDMGPGHYDITKYDAYPVSGVKAPTLAPYQPMPKFSEYPRFHISKSEQDAIDRMAKVPFPKLPKWLDSCIDPNKGTPFSSKHRFTPREEWLVENPHMYLAKGDGSFVSEKMPHHRYIEDPKRMHRKIAKEQGRVKLVELEFDRSKNFEGNKGKKQEKLDLAEMLRREGATDGPSDEDRWRGLGPYLGYNLTSEYAMKFKPNVVKCTIGSQVPRDDSTIIGGRWQTYDDYPENGPGVGFDASDQAWCQTMWGRHIAWNRHKIQVMRGKPKGYVCPLVAAADEELRQRKAYRESRVIGSKKREPKNVTIQSTWHGKLKHACKMDDDWAKRPEKYGELLAREKRQERIDSKRNSAASSVNASRRESVASKTASKNATPRQGALSAPPEVTVKSRSSVAVESVAL